MKLLISDYDLGFVFSACTYTPRIGWKEICGQELDMIAKEYFGHSSKEFAQNMFVKILECSEIVICSDGCIEIFELDEYSLARQVEL